MAELTGRIDGFSIDFVTGKAILNLQINEKQSAIQTYDELAKEKKLSIKIGKYREKRSLNANNYAWKLIAKIAEKQGITKEEVYRQHIKEIGVYRQVEIDEKAADTLIHSWGLHGIGWVSEKIDYGQHTGFVLINLYYGSSTYNKKQMGRLIDNIVQDCEALGIGTKTPEEIERLKSLWESK